jgi:hypothetical protein
MLKLRRESSKQWLADRLSLQITTMKMETPGECYLDKEGLFLYINILTDRRCRLGKTQANVLGET